MFHRDYISSKLITINSTKKNKPISYSSYEANIKVLGDTLVQIIIPMSGFGERFREAGYNVPKPLIEIDGKPIIAHVVDMFPGEKDFIFICNQDHLDNPGYAMEPILKHHCPSGKIIGIPPHKLGPIHAVHQITSLIDPKQPAIVNYCDFTCYWDWAHFKQFVEETQCDGAIPAYKGFHPHTLGNTNYAYIRETAGWVDDIQEKQPYTDNRMEEYASSGSYYFASGQLMSESFHETMEKDINVGGEYYCSLAYKPLLAAQRRIAVYPLQHFMQWGTPDDVAEYNSWSRAFRQLVQPKQKATTPNGALVIPMAGLGQRFLNEGYTTTKPLIPVSGKPMVTQATNDLPTATQHVFVLRKDMSGYQKITDELISIYPDAVIKTIASVTGGQACTALIGLDALEEQGSVQGPITFGACDNGALYKQEALQRLLNNPDIDVIVWGVRGHVNAVRQPQMFGWIDEKNGRIENISVKEPLDYPSKDPIILGTFTFRTAEDFRRVVNRLIERNGQVNGEYYIDSCINDALELGLSCQLFEVDSFLCWGTPNDLRTFEYWQSCFHKWEGHPYSLTSDARIPAQETPSLAAKYGKTIPLIPETHAP
jgi:NDP-sugar pyrophosphorylase family protein